MRIWSIAVLALWACAAPREEAPPPGEVAVPPPLGTRPATVDTTEIRGTLQWSDLGVRMVGRADNVGLQIDVTTIADESVALAADDVRQYFRDLKKKIPEAVPPREARELVPFLVGYTGIEKEVSFDPTRLEIRSEGSTFYPRYIVPVSPQFERRLVDLYQTVYALYLFDPDLDLKATLEFRYGDMSSGTAWRQVVQRIQRAKTRLEGGMAPRGDRR